jgi:hypothetical protein
LLFRQARLIYLSKFFKEGEETRWASIFFSELFFEGLKHHGEVSLHVFEEFLYFKHVTHLELGLPGFYPVNPSNYPKFRAF